MIIIILIVIIIVVAIIGETTSGFPRPPATHPGDREVRDGAMREGGGCPNLPKFNQAGLVNPQTTRSLKRVDMVINPPFSARPPPSPASRLPDPPRARPVLTHYTFKVQGVKARALKCGITAWLDLKKLSSTLQCRQSLAHALLVET